MPRGPKKTTAKTIRTEITALQKKVKTRQEKIEQYKDEIRVFRSEIKKLERQETKLLQDEFVEKMFALSRKHHVPIEDVADAFSFLTELRNDTENQSKTLEFLRDYFRQEGNKAGLAWIDSVERWIRE